MNASFVSHRRFRFRDPKAAGIHQPNFWLFAFFQLFFLGGLKRHNVELVGVQENLFWTAIMASELNELQNATVGMTVGVIEVR